MAGIYDIIVRRQQLHISNIMTHDEIERRAASIPAEERPVASSKLSGLGDFLGIYGGARFDTDGHSPRIKTPLVSGVSAGETDGGLTKLGAGTLTLTGANGYTGPTRLEGGTLVFNSDRPDGDIEFPAAALTVCTNAAAPLPWAKSIGSFRSGCGIRVTECETLDSASWSGGWHTVARFSETDLDALPAIKFVKSDGTVVSNGNGWTFRINADRRRLEFRGFRGTLLLVR